MGRSVYIDYDRFPKQSEFCGKRVQVVFHYGQKRIEGEMIRDDIEGDMVGIIRLDDGRVVLTTECQHLNRRGDRLMEVQQRIAELSKSGIVTDELDKLRAERGSLEKAKRKRDRRRNSRDPNLRLAKNFSSVDW
jgi:hypothetical protein